MIKGLHHGAIVVPDFKAGLRFHVGTLGFSVFWRTSLDRAKAGAGRTFHRPPVDLGDGPSAIYGPDPFGNVLELYQTGAA